jgi:hypothetical protein
MLPAALCLATPAPNLSTHCPLTVPSVFILAANEKLLSQPDSSPKVAHASLLPIDA